MVISKRHNPTYTTRCLMDMYTTNVESAEAIANESVQVLQEGQKSTEA